jgi:proline racemase/trans-L-3-hydroxyproline dehydratase
MAASEIATTDYHTAGEPFRIVTAGAPGLPGDSVRDRRERAQQSVEADYVRSLLCNEPRGHADMYGCFVVPPDDDGADLGVLFWHKDGFSTACGHGTIALGAWAVESGRIAAAPDGVTDVTIDVPSGRVVAAVTCRGGEVESVAFRNVPAYVIDDSVRVDTYRGSAVAGVAYGGAIYASVAARDLGMAVTPEHYSELIAVGRAVKRSLEGSPVARHPADDRLSGIYGTIFYDDLGDTDAGPRQRNVAVFADGEVDRSPCGSGTSARAALLVAAGSR